jgi:hypothetical protein
VDVTGRRHVDRSTGPSQIHRMRTLPTIHAAIVAAMLATAGPAADAQTAEVLQPDTRVRVWSRTHNLRGTEGRVVERWGDTLVVSIPPASAMDDGPRALVIPFAALQQVERWVEGVRPPLRRRWLGPALLAGGGVALVTVVSGNPYAVGAAITSGALVLLFLAIGADQQAQSAGDWVAVPLAPAAPAADPTAPGPAAPDRS